MCCRMRQFFLLLFEGARWASVSSVKTSLSWVFGWDAPVGAPKKTSRHCRRAIVDLALPESLNTTVSYQSPPRQQALPLPPPLIFECFLVYLVYLSSSISP